MSHDRPGGRRAIVRAFRPMLEGCRLELRQLLASVASLAPSHVLLTNPSVNVAKALNDPKHFSPQAPYLAPAPNYNHGVADVNTARGGQSAIVAMPDGSRFRVSLSLADNQFGTGLSGETGSSATNVVPSSTPVQPIGTVRVYPMPGGQVGIIVDGSTQYQQLTIDPLPVTQRKGFAHSFSYGEAGRTEILNIGSIQINGGQIQAILGYHSANLAGPLTVGGTGTVDRIAFNALMPGAAIGISGSLNTLDIANDATLSAGAGIHIGQDLNLLNVGGNLTLMNGTNFVVGRFLGLTPQPPKGTAPGSNFLSLNQSTLGTTSSSSLIAPSLSGHILGNLTIGPGSTLSIASGISSSSVNATTGGVTASPLLIDGQLQLATLSNLNIFNLKGNISNSLGTQSPIVARNGATLNGVVVLPPG